MKNVVSRILPFTALPLLLLAGCHHIFGPEGGRQDWWTYCDITGCYECNEDGCGYPGRVCGSSSPCPSGYYCDGGSCRSKSCSSAADCGTDQFCINGRCTPQLDPCTDNADCGAGAYCQNGQCAPSGTCTKDEDCASLGNFVCDSRGACVPGQPKPKPCTSASTCSGGMCVDGQCGTCSSDCGGGKTCQINKHCGAGRVCLDGQCTSSCTTAADCGTGQTCKSKVCVADTSTSCQESSQCASGQVCVNNTCSEDCTTTGTCTDALDVCSDQVTLQEGFIRFCHADHAAKPECTVSKDCTGGETCVNGVCRTACATSTDCAACSDGPVCSNGGYCMTSAEANPQCTLNANCTSGKVCLNAQCTTL